MRNRITLITIMLFSLSVCFSQTDVKRYRVKGRIIDAQTKGTLENFPIKIKESNRKLHANERGEFLFNMPQNTYTLVFDDYPYSEKELILQLISDTVLEIAMITPPAVHRLREVQVVANRKLSEKPTGITKISSADIATLPAMVGERDLLKVISLNAGVSSSGEGAADIQVRGGVHGQNLFLLDKVPLYSTQHMFGMVSVYNPTIIKSAELYKAGFPAEYGGRIASVLDVRTKDPDLNRFGGEVDISILSTKLALNMPIIKEKLAITLAGRISNYSLINLVSLTSLIKGTKLASHFADLNSSVIYKPSDKDEIKLSLFHNSDGLNINQKEQTMGSDVWLNNQQQNLILNWKRKLSDKSFNTVQVFVDKYKFDFGSETISASLNSSEFFKINSSISSSGAENRFDTKVSDKLSINAGINLKTYAFSAFNIDFTDTSFVSSQPSLRKLEGNVFTQAKYLLASGQTVDVGLRLSSFGDSNQSFFSLEPRFSYHALISKDFSVSASASRMTQNIHRIANPGMGISMELFQPSDSYLQPEKSWVFSLGTAKDFSSGNHLFSVEADLWYKKMWNLVDFKDGFDTFSMLMSTSYAPDDNSQYLTQGKGKAYGIDISGNYTFRKLKLSADYTLMKARNQFNDLNQGRWFAASTDIRHSLNLISEFKLKRNWVFTAIWQLRSGRPMTLPTAIYPINEIDFSTGAVSFSKEVNSHEQHFQMIETERNNARMRPFHKLDIAFNRTYLTKKKYTANLSIGLYNVYNRANPAYYFIDNKKTDGIYYPVLKSISMFPVLPSFTWGMKF